MNQSSYIIFHNPRCSKSRLALELLHENGIEPDIFEYLKMPMDHSLLKDTCNLLGKRPKEILRTKEDEYKALSIDFDNDDQVIDAIINFPKILERPIVVKKEVKAIIGRPPENILDFLDN